MKGKIRIIGMGPGHPEYMIPAALKAIEDCDVLIGGPRNLEAFQHSDKKLVAIDANLDRLSEYLTLNALKQKIAVLVSGDPGIFSIQKLLRQKLPNFEIETLPGISSLQYFCARVGKSWDDLWIISLHGRDQGNFIDGVREHPKVGVFTGGKNSPGAVCQRLQEAGIDNVRVTVGERLSYPDERVVCGDLQQIGAMEFDSLAIMLIEQTTLCTSRENFPVSGVPDEFFIRNEIPMTKEEIRAVSLAKLRLRCHDIVYDIGAGTGSVTIEAAIHCRNGRVFAIEKEAKAQALIEQNLQQFSLSNVQVISGEAPQALEGLPEPDRVFIGGSDGKLSQIIQQLRHYRKTLRVVINAVTLETTAEAMASLAANGFTDIEATSLAVSRSRKVGEKNMMIALNPVTIITAAKETGEC